MLSDPREIREFRENLEMMGEHKVREFIAHRRFSSDKLLVAQEWLAQQVEERQELRAAETLELAGWANKLAVVANGFAFLATVIAVVAIFVK
jgi:hypothetical protein